MQVVNPSVTWPNHTSMVTGVAPAKHSVLYNGLAVRGGEGEPLRVEPWLDKDVLVKAPTLYDAAHAAGLTTAQVDWVAIQNAKTITWEFPERPRVEGGIEREMIVAGLVSEEEIRGFAKAPIVWRDEIWTRAGIHLIEKHRPNLLLFHLLTTDSAQHRYGAGSLAGNTAMALADSKVERLLDALRAAGIFDRTTVFIVADHGFKTYRHVIHPNAFLRRNGHLRDRDGKLDCDAWVIPEGGTAMVYATRRKMKPEIVRKLAAEFSKLEGVARVIAPSDFDALGYPQPESNDRMADLVLAAAEGYAFDAVHTGEPVTEVSAGSSPGAHGYLNSDPDMNASFIAWGSGIKPGVKLGTMRNLDIAPTVAKILGLQMGNVAGRVLDEILE